jgi:hypothetical protein
MNLDKESNAKFETGIEIFKPRYYEILENISYDKEKRVFNLKNISSDLKSLFIKAGLRKKDLKNPSFALNIFKAFILFFDSIQQKKKMQTQKIFKVKNRLDVSKIDDEDAFYRKSMSNFEDIAKKFKVENQNLRTAKSVLFTGKSVPNVPIAPPMKKFNVIIYK